MNPVLTFDHDQLNLDVFAKRFESYILVEHDFVEGSLVTALDGPFGSGKSTLLSMWKADLARRKGADPELPIVISLNSWEDDFCGDPLLSIAGAFLKAIPKEKGGETGEAGKQMREALRDVFWFAAALGNGVVAQATGINLMEAGTTAETKKGVRNSPPSDFVALYDQRINALADLRQSLLAAFGGETVKAIVFVDELDRCRPDFAIQYLETIKHVFNIHGLAFVLAIDQNQISCSAKALFGRELNTAEYLRKFIHRTVSLPEPNASALKKLTADYVPRYLSRSGKRHSKLDLSNLAKRIIPLLASLKLNPRQIQEVFRILGHVTQAESDDPNGKLTWGYDAATLLLTALRVSDKVLYSEIGRGTASREKVGKFLFNALGGKDARWWFAIYLMGTLSEQDSKAGFSGLFRSIGWLDRVSDEEISKELGGFWQAFDHYQSEPFKIVYSMLEALASFENPLERR